MVQSSAQIAPRCPSSQDSKDAVQDTAVVYTRNTAWLARQHRLDGSRLMVGEFIAHDSNLRFGGLNHGSAADLNIHIAGALVAISPKADPLCSLRVLLVLTHSRRNQNEAHQRERRVRGRLPSPDAGAGATSILGAIFTIRTIDRRRRVSSCPGVNRETM